MKIKLSFRKHLLKLGFEKDRKVLCFTNTHYLLTGIILHISQSTKASLYLYVKPTWTGNMRKYIHIHHY